MGNNDNLADNTNQTTYSAEATSLDAPFVTKRKSTIPTNNAASHAAETLTNRLTTPSQPSYSFPRTTRLPPSKPKSQSSSRSTSPNKPAGSSGKETKTVKHTTQGVSAKTKPLAKPASPLSTYQFGSPSSKPATSNVTVTTSGVVPSTDIPDLRPPYISPSRSSTAETELPTAQVTSSTIPRPSAHMAGFDTIVEGDEIDPPINARGNASLYKESPMAKLLNEYLTEQLGDSSLSTEATIILLVTMQDLEAEHITIVEDRNRGTTKYKLSDDLLEDLSRITVELQVYVEKAANFIDERSRHFTVDPKDTLLQILRGTTSLPQLNVAWKTMQKRLELGHKTLQKYALQYQGDPHDELLLSPISTLPELHQELQDLHTADQRLRLLYQKFPHHHEQLTSQAETALNQSKSWMNILPLPQALKSAFIPEKETTNRRQSVTEAKGKQKETQVETRDDNDIGNSNRVWLGSDTPYKGPNKWFGGGRLQSRESRLVATTFMIKLRQLPAGRFV